MGSYQVQSYDAYDVNKGNQFTYSKEPINLLKVYNTICYIIHAKVYKFYLSLLGRYVDIIRTICYIVQHSNKSILVLPMARICMYLG